MTQETFDVCIVGGGVIGLAIANQLARRKMKVVIVERASSPATEASSDNGGATWPFAQMLYEPYLYGIVKDGIEAHKRLSSSGLRYDFRVIPCIFACFDQTMMDGLLKQLETMPSTERYEVMSKKDVLDGEPTLSSEIVGGVLFPDCSHGEANILCAELVRETTKAGVSMRTSTEVTGFAKEGRTVRRAVTSSGEIAADQFVIAAGPWSSTLSDALGVGMPTIPIKGHIVSWRSDPPFLSHLIWTGMGALLPGRMAVRAGGGMDFTGYDKTPNRRTIDVLISTAIRTVPSLEERTPQVWTGLRPGTPDALPIIGRSKRLENVVIATGHYHEGFSGSAITAEIAADLLTGGTSDKPYLEMFNPDRFNC